MSIDTGPRTAPARPLTRAEGQALMESQYQALLDLLRSLPAEEWNAVTDCAPWTVKDIAAHLIGWAAAFTSPAEYARQLAARRSFKKQLGNTTDAQNQVQVEMRKHLTPEDLLRDLEKVLPRFARVRNAFGYAGKALPLYLPGLLGFTNVAYLMMTIFSRDAFMHRVDIARATNRDLVLGGPEARLIEDVAVDWSRRLGVAARLHLTGGAGGEYVVGTAPRADLTADAIVFARVLAGRGDPSEVEVSGDVEAAHAWLTKGCPF